MALSVRCDESDGRATTDVRHTTWGTQDVLEPEPCQGASSRVKYRCSVVVPLSRLDSSRLTWFRLSHVIGRPKHRWRREVGRPLEYASEDY